MCSFRGLYPASCGREESLDTLLPSRLMPWRASQVQAEREKRQQRRSQLKRVGQGARLRSFMQQCLMRVGYVFADHTRNALILSVFAFKVSHQSLQ